MLLQLRVVRDEQLYTLSLEVSALLWQSRVVSDEGSVGSDVIWLELQLSDSNELGSVGNDDKLLL